MKVAQVVLNLQYGGLEKLVIQLSQRLNNSGISTIIICLDDIGDLALEAQKRGVEVVSLNKTPGFKWKWVFELKKILKEHKVDLVHSHNYAPLVYGTLAAKLAGIRSINTRHSRTQEKISRFIWNLNKFITTVSEDTRTEILKHNRISKDKLKVVHNGIDLEAFNIMLSEQQIKEKKQSLGIAEDSYVIGNIGRLVEDKDQETLLKAYKKLFKKNFNGDLVIVGDGRLKEALVAKAQEYGIQDRVKFLGFRDDVSELIQIFDIYVLSSIREGVSLTLLEAMAARKTVIATKIGGNPEVVVDGSTGYLVPCGFPERIESAIMRLYVNRNLAVKMGEAGAERARELFSLKRMTDSYVELYNAALK